MNHIKISGTLESLYFSHTVCDRPRYEGVLKVPRSSGACDHIHIQMWDSSLTVGDAYMVEGEVRTNRYSGDNPQHPHKMSYVTVTSIAPCDPDSVGINEVHISGEVIYKSSIRKTPVSDKQIQPFQLFVPSKHHRSYPNIIAWEELAVTVANTISVNQIVSVIGRLQSREYVKDGAIYRIHEICATEVEYLGKDTESNPSET